MTEKRPLEEGDSLFFERTDEVIWFLEAGSKKVRLETVDVAFHLSKQDFADLLLSGDLVLQAEEDAETAVPGASR